MNRKSTNINSVFTILNGRCHMVMCRETSNLCEAGCKEYIYTEVSCEFCNNCKSC